MLDGAGNEVSFQQVVRELCDIWQEALSLGIVVKPDDDFFELGGDSLNVVDVVLLAKERGISFRTSAVFRNPTPAGLAESVLKAG
jgi:acyl carrier protein